MTNRLWNLWCKLSGVDILDPRLMMAFNVDRRIAMLSAHPADVVEALAVELWANSADPHLDAFLDEWLTAVDGVLEQERIVLERKRRAAEVERRRQLQVAERQRLAGELEHRRAHELAEREQRARELERRRDAQRHRLETRRRIPWLYNITAVGNVASIAVRGILCHEQATRVPHDDLSNRSVQDRRSHKVVAGGLGLHELASLYFNPKNAMLYQLCSKGRDVIVLRVSPDVLDLPGVAVTDGNAASAGTKSWLSHEGLENVCLDQVYMQTWNSPEEKRVRQAEVLVPQRVPPDMIQGFISPSASICERVQRAVPDWQGTVDSALFFGRT